VTPLPTAADWDRALAALRRIGCRRPAPVGAYTYWPCPFGRPARVTAVDDEGEERASRDFPVIVEPRPEGYHVLYVETAGVSWTPIEVGASCAVTCSICGRVRFVRPANVPRSVYCLACQEAQRRRKVAANVARHRRRDREP
jgi:hypothetical protein